MNGDEYTRDLARRAADTIEELLAERKVLIAALRSVNEVATAELKLPASFAPALDAVRDALRTAGAL